MGKYRWLPLAVLLAGTLALWPLRDRLTAERIAAWSPRESGLAVVLLLALYAAKSLSVAFPLSALEAAGGLLFPLPAALAVNLMGTVTAQIIPFLMGRREQAELETLTARHPRLAALRPGDHPGRTVFLLRLAGASPGDLVSLYLGAAGVPLRAYVTGGALGSLPRMAASTIVGAALWEIGSPRFWLSLLPKAALTGLSLLLWRVWRKQ